MALAKLPTATVRLIGSSQVITSVTSVVKELLENSIDSGANNIEIKLEKHGLEKIEVKDDGCGIKSSEATVMCLPSYTSKISDFSDLDNLSSYGFRGEALSSLCNVAQVTITSKSADDDIALCYTYDNSGRVVSSKASHIAKGTIVLVTELFKNLPVRKQFLSNSKRAADELKKLEKIVKCLAMIHPRLRVTLVHNKFMIWQKTSVANLRHAFMQVVPLATVKQLHHTVQHGSQVRVEMLVPSRECNIASLCFTNFADAHFLFINNRPVRNKEVEKAVYNKIFEYFGVYIPTKKYPVCVTSLVVPADSLDVNLEPDKSRVYIKNQEDVLEIITQCLLLYYGEGKKESEDDKLTSKAKKRKVEDGCLEESREKATVHIPSYSDETASSQELSSQSTKSSELELEAHTENCKEVERINVPRNDREVDDSFVSFCLERNTQSQSPIENVTSPKTNKLLESSINDELIFSQEMIIDGVTKENDCSSLESKVTCPNKTVARNLTVNETIKSSNTVSNFFRKTSQDKDGFQVTNFDRNKTCVLDHTQQEVMKGEELAINCDEPFYKKEQQERDHASSTGTFEIQIDETVSPEKDHYVKPRFSKKEEVFPVVQREKEGFSNLAGISLPTLSQWSRGDISFESERKPVEYQEPSQGNETSSPQSSQIPSNRSVSSQMGCKEMSAFTKFARNMRKKILEENPSMSFTRVAQQLQVQWRQLNTEERRKYEATPATVQTLRSPDLKRKQATLSSFLERSADIELDIDFESFKEQVKNTLVNRVDLKPRVSLVGQLEASTLWVYRWSHSSAELEVCSLRRLQEAVMFHRHMAQLQLTTRLLDEPIQFTTRDLGEEDWSLLLSLNRSPNGVITDPRLVSNGFVVDILEGESQGCVSYVPQHIAYCGLEEIQEVLGLLRTHGRDASLAQCRPLKVVSFLRSEAMRDCSKSLLPSSKNEVQELLIYWLDNVLPETPNCIHHLPVSQPLYSVKSV